MNKNFLIINSHNWVHVEMTDMIISKWDSGESYNQGPPKKTGLSPNSIFDTIDRQILGA